MAIIIFIFCLSFLIFLHEFGHFLAAKKAGVKVEEFGFGYPPRLFGIKKGETIYSLNTLPFGGFVKILGEDGRDRENRRSLASRRPKIKSQILIAGIVMNLIFGIGLLSFGYLLGLPVLVDEKNIGEVKNLNLSILNVSSKTPASEAGIKAGDILLRARADKEEIFGMTSETFQKFIKKYQGKEVVLTLQRQNQIFEKKVISRLNPPKGEGPLGVVIGEAGTLRYPFFKSIAYGIRDGVKFFFNIFVALFYFVKSLILKTETIGGIIGPVGITAMGAQVVRLGVNYLLQFLAALSINLAALNLIPFPALDGSRLLFVLIEKIKGKPVSARLENLIHSFGFACLILLVIVVTTKDIIRLF